MYFALLVFWITVLVTVAVSMLTKPPAFKQVTTTDKPTSHIYMYLVSNTLRLYKEIVITSIGLKHRKT